jgi:hypothetical protein
VDDGVVAVPVGERADASRCAAGAGGRRPDRTLCCHHFQLTRRVTVRSIDLIRENLKRSEDIVLARVEEMRDHCVVFPTPQGGCHTLWVLGHLAYIETLVVRRFMLGGSNPLDHWEELFDGADVSGEIDHFPPFDQVLTECRKARASTVSLIDSLTESDLDKASVYVPGGVEDLFRHLSALPAVRRGPLVHAPRATG